MLQILKNLFLGYFNYQQDKEKLKDLGLTHIISIVDPKFIKNDKECFLNGNSRLYLEKYFLHGQVLDVLVVMLDQELDRQTSQHLICLEVPFQRETPLDETVIEKVCIYNSKTEKQR